MKTIGQIVNEVRKNSEIGEVYAALNDDKSMVEFFGAYKCPECGTLIRAGDGTAWLAVEEYTATQLAKGLADHVIGRYDLEEGDVTEDGDDHCGCLNT